MMKIFADDQRNHTLGCAGHPVVKTPHIDRLAAEGVRFENAFVSTSTCWVSRACLFTGCYERGHLYRVKPGPLDPELCATSYFAVVEYVAEILVGRKTGGASDVGDGPRGVRKQCARFLHAQALKIIGW